MSIGVWGENMAGFRRHLRLQYTGAYSLNFWRIVNSISGKRGEEAVKLASELQEVEKRVIRFIKNAKKEDRAEKDAEWARTHIKEESI